MPFYFILVDLGITNSSTKITIKACPQNNSKSISTLKRTQLKHFRDNLKHWVSFCLTLSSGQRSDVEISHDHLQVCSRKRPESSDRGMFLFHLFSHEAEETCAHHYFNKRR